MSFHILTMNIHKGFSAFNRRFVLDKLKDAIHSISPDIAFLQEVTGENKAHADIYPNWPQTPHYQYLAEHLWKDVAYAKSAEIPGGHHGNAILSKHPIKVVEAVDISESRFESRNFLYCEIDISGSDFPLHAICVHLGLLQRWRKSQLGQLKTYIEKNVPAHHPLIVAGDFNDWTVNIREEFTHTLQLNEAFTLHKGKKAKSFPARMPLLKLDRIYIRGMDVLSTTTYSKGQWAKLSDHAALVAEVNFSAASEIA